ncbi:MAG TPA: glutamate--cysteine ligase [Thioalkalivibrio sp.]|nr:glutamate--cysteine ligase [Thioalkalivibrio sp.]
MNPDAQVLPLYRLAEQRLGRLLTTGQQHLLRDGLVGLEKESLRVSPNGGIAQTPHPKALGSALTHPYITTDYSEALLELITPPFTDRVGPLRFLEDLQKFVYPRLDSEILWATSMPCVVAGEDSIPIAQYGSSNVGLMKTVYRRGLGYRYGRVMQVIAGVHYNYSVPEALWPALRELDGDGGDASAYRSRAYFGMIRNLQRVGWLIPYLFGASPAVCKSFFGDQHPPMPQFDRNTCYEPYATSLRMGDIGYTNAKEGETGIKACYDDLACYVKSLACAIETPYPEYERIGVCVDGEYRQLNANILQIENEYYSTVRPKQILQGLEKPTCALAARGVRYVELRSVDVNAFHPLGIDLDQVYFIEALMLFCLLADSPPIDADERTHIDFNQSAISHRGREPGLKLRRSGGEIALKDWALEVLGAMQGVCELLDGDAVERPYSRVLATQVEAVHDPERTPSARMLAEMRANGEGFYHFARRMSQAHGEYFNALPPRAEAEALLERLAVDSLAEQAALEAEPQAPFDEFLKAYFAERPPQPA